MADKLARSKQYEYRANSNLVLQADRSGTPREEATGEPESLWGRMKGRMGDRAVVQSNSREFQERLQARKRTAKIDKNSDDNNNSAKKRQKAEKESVLQASLNEAGRYRPKTRETRRTYETILTFVGRALGDEPPEVLRESAEEIISILRSDMQAPQKKRSIEELVGLLAETQFTDLTNQARVLTDFTLDDTSSKESRDDEVMDETHGVPLVFEDSDAENEEPFEIREESDDEEGVETSLEEMRTLGAGDEGEDDMDDPLNIDPKEIKAFWLKSQVVKNVDPDPVNSQRLAEQILTILEIDDERECENKLVQLLDFEKFDFIRLLMRNRLKIVWCTKLVHAEDDAQRNAIEDQMQSDSRLVSILDQLRRTSDKAKDMERALKREARMIKSRDKDASDEMSGPTKFIDFESLAFNQGGHFMANKVTSLPKGAFKKTGKGYEEVHIPALKAPPMEANEELVKIESLPRWAHAGFAGMATLNRVQSRLYPAAFGGHENILLCAPTGAGKTNVAMMCIMREIGLNRNPETGEIDLDNFKIVYIAPMKALVQECVGNFGKRLAPYHITVRELTGDMNLTKQQLKETQVIVTTPEKWDVITRKSGDRTFTQLVRLIIFDEIHLLHDDRGPVLESIIARTTRQIENTQEMIRMVGLSATLPNYEDVAMVLRVKKENLFPFDNSFRPCPLEQQYIGVSEKKATKRLQIMNEICYAKIMEQAGKNQVLVFVHSRKDTVKTAKALRDMAMANDTLTKFIREGTASREILQTEADEQIKNEDLKEILPYGFGVHHAGLVRSDRTLVEDLFADGHIQVLVSTATLAWGVNLPAHSVIIKGTQVYNPEKGKWTELSYLDVMQMLGRAGRPSFDTFGEGIVITTSSELQFYLSLLNQQLSIESQYISKLADNLNAEIVLGTVQNVEEGVNWLGYTYLYVRMIANPTLYGISYSEAEDDSLLIQRRRDLIHSAATLLDKANLIKYDRKSGNFHVTDLGVVASHYYVSYLSMQTYHEHLKPNISEIDLFRLFSLSNEFKNITIRSEERIEVETLLDRVPIPIKESVEEPTAKINVLLQAYISRLKLEGFALISDMVYVTQSAARLMRAIFEICLKRGWAQLANKVLDLCKMVDKRMWASMSPLRQFAKIPEDIIKKIERKDFPFERLYDLDPQKIGELINFPPMGKVIHKTIHEFPRLELTAHVQPVTRQLLRVALTVTPNFRFEEGVHSNAEGFWIMVEDVDGEKILHHEYFILKKKFSQEEHVVTFYVPLYEIPHPQYFIKVVSDRWIGSESVLPISFRQLVLPERFPPSTELLDLKAAPISQLEDPKLEALYDFKTFLPIQTQTFKTLYQSDANTFIAAPTGSGKTVCAEFAIFRVFKLNPTGKVVYIGPTAPIVNVRFRDWSKKFGQLGISVAKFSGDQIADLKILETFQIILSTPENWDLISRRWKIRPAVSNVSLFIADEIHLIDSEIGPTYEIIISRMRYLSSQKDENSPKIRLLGLSSSLANGRDVAEWMGCQPATCFNFHPNSRPVTLEIHLQGFDIPHFGHRLIAMSRPTMYAVAHHGQGKPTIIFVPHRKQARMTARDLINFYDPEDGNKNWLKIPKEVLQPHLENITNKTLKESLEYGIGMYTEAMNEQEKRTVERLFQAGAIQIMIVTHCQIWEITSEAHLVVIMGTQSWYGKEHRYADYPVSDLLQMVGKASRPQTDQLGKCVLYCFGPKKEFYKKFLYDPLPLESHLDQYLSDFVNAEIMTRVIQSPHDAVDYLTWTFLYRRISQNPNYYHLTGTSHRHISDYLSELVESTLSDLAQSKCIQVEDEEISSLNLGMIACYYNIKTATVDMFSQSLKDKTKAKGILEVLSAASEFENLPLNQGEEKILRKLGNHMPMKIEKPDYTSIPTKVNVLLQCHFQRRGLTVDLQKDLDQILEISVKLLQAMVDVISSSSWLGPALAAMEISQMITQAQWSTDSPLKQIPHFDDDMVARCRAAGCQSVYDISEMEDEVRDQALQLDAKQMEHVALFCNRYPNIEINFEVADADDVRAGADVKLNVSLEREMDDDAALTPAMAAFFPKERLEGWWLVLGDPTRNELISIKRVNLGRRATHKLEFKAPESVGTHEMKLYFMCDSYLGCDQEESVKLRILPAAEKGDEMEE